MILALVVLINQRVLLYCLCQRIALFGSRQLLRRNTASSLSLTGERSGKRATNSDPIKGCSRLCLIALEAGE